MMDDQVQDSVTVLSTLLIAQLNCFTFGYQCNYANLKDTAGQSAPLLLAPSDHLHRKEGVR